MHFRSVKKFEESISKPVGKQWVRDVDYWRKIRPRVEVKMGEVLEPIDKSSLISKKDESKGLGGGKGSKVKGQKPAGRKRKFPKLNDKLASKKMKE